MRKRGREDDDLGRGGQVAVDVVDLVLETLVEELVGLIEDEHLQRAQGGEVSQSSSRERARRVEGSANLDVPRPEVPPSDHVEHSTRRSTDDVLSVVELLDVLPNASSSNAGVALDVHVVSEGEDDALDLGGQFSSGGEDEGLGLSDGGVDRLEGRDREGRGLSGSRLSLGDNVSA